MRDLAGSGIRPTGCELIDKKILDCTKDNLEQSRNRAFVVGDPGAVLVVELRGAVRAASVSERRRAFEEGLCKGDFVYLPRHRKRCQVLKVDHGRGMLLVRLGRMDLEVRIDEATGFEEL